MKFINLIVKSINKKKLKRNLLANENQFEEIEKEGNILSKQIYSIQCNQINVIFNEILNII